MSLKQLVINKIISWVSRMIDLYINLNQIQCWQLWLLEELKDLGFSSKYTAPKMHSKAFEDNFGALALVVYLERLHYLCLCNGKQWHDIYSFWNLKIWDKVTNKRTGFLEAIWYSKKQFSPFYCYNFFYFWSSEFIHSRLRSLITKEIGRTVQRFHL